MKSSRAVSLTASLLLLWGCQGAEAPGSSTPAISGDPVVVYASYADTTYLPELFADFTRETGAPVIVRNGEPDAMVNDVIDSHIDPPADILLTPGVAGVWRAADEGALRPLQSAVVEARVAPWLRDADGFWTALSYRTAGIVYDPAQVEIEEPIDLKALAEPQFKGKLCLAKAANSISLAVIAQWISELGIRDTELIVRGWANNLAVPAFETEAAVLKAISERRCAVGLVSSHAYAGAAVSNADTPYRSAGPMNVYADIEGIGIARHARNPDGARALIEWLLGDAIQRKHMAGGFSNPATKDIDGSRSVGLVAYHREDALNLAERARYW